MRGKKIIIETLNDLKIGEPVQEHVLSMLKNKITIPNTLVTSFNIVLVDLIHAQTKMRLRLPSRQISNGKKSDESENSILFCVCLVIRLGLSRRRLILTSLSLIFMNVAYPYPS